MFRNTDFARQKRMLEESLRTIVSASEANIASDAFLASMAERHKQLRIKPAHYGLWEQSLLDTVAVCDPQFSDEIRGAWIDVLQRGINFLKNY